MELVLLAILVLVVVAILAMVNGSRRTFRMDNEVVPGVATSAPPEWAGAHTVEARMHRGLRDTIRALHRVPGVQDQLGEVRRALEEEALAIDAQLVAVAALPERVRSAPLARVGAAAQAMELAVAELASQRPSSADAVADVLDDAIERQRMLEEARAELDLLDGTSIPLPQAPRRVEVIHPGDPRRADTAASTAADAPAPAEADLPSVAGREDEAGSGGQQPTPAGG